MVAKLLLELGKAKGRLLPGMESLRIGAASQAVQSPSLQCRN